MKKAFPILMPFLMLAVGGCACCGNMVLTAEDAGKTCDFKASGDRCVEIRLTANPTTGFQWEFTVEGDAVAVTGEEYHTRKGGEQLCGAGGVTTLTLAPVRNGSGKVIARYLRPWEKDVDPADSLFWEISVTGMPEE